MLLTPGFKEIEKSKIIIKYDISELNDWDFEKKQVIDFEVQENSLFLNIVEDLLVKTIEISVDMKDKKQEVICYEFLTKAFDHMKYCFQYDIGRGLSKHYKRLYDLFSIKKNENYKDKIINQFTTLEKYESKFNDVINEFSFRVMKSTDVLQSFKKENEYFANCAVLKEKETNKIKIYIYGCDDSSYTRYCSSIEEAHILTLILRTEYSIDTERLVEELHFNYTN